MPIDSDTESDSGASVTVNEIECSFASSSFLQRTPTCDTDADPEELLDKRALLAIEQVRLFDLTAVQRDDSLHKDILVASDLIVRFIDANSSPTLGISNRAKALLIFADLVDVSFLSILFSHRKVAQDIAAKAITPSPTSSTVVCWVDVLLAKLSTFAMTIASGFSPESQAPYSDYMRAQREEHYIWAASQLPEKWSAMADVTASNQSSPAARRLAMRLLFAAYVMGPQLSGCKCWTALRTRPEDMMKSMLSSISQKQPYNGLSITPSAIEYDDDERTHYAMLISLYIASQIAERESQADKSQSPLRIRTLGSFLDIIQLVQHGNAARAIDNKTHPYEHLDLAQTVLIRWGEVVPWCWATWDDQRTANVECITDLTITWLYHLNSPFCLHQSPAAFKVPMEIIFTDDIAHSGAAILHVLHRTTLRLSTSQQLEQFPLPLAIVVRKSCWAVNHFLRSTIGSPSHRTDPLVPAFCRCLVILFCALRETEEEINIKDLVLEGLTLVESRILHSVLQNIKQDNSLQLATQFDDAVVRTRRALSAPLLEASTLLVAKLNLEFFTLIWHSKIEKFITYGTTSSFLRAVLDVLECQTQETRTSPILADTLLTALSVTSYHAAFETAHVNREELVWDLALQADCCNLVAASGFAHHISMTDRAFEPLQYLEAWDYLRDALLLIFSGRLVEEDEALALLVCPMLCTALSKILQFDSPSSRFILSSPWTISLCTQLLTLTDDENRPVSQYMVALHHRIKGAGKALLDQISRKLHGNDEPVDNSHIESQLVYCYAITGSRLVLVPLA